MWGNSDVLYIQQMIEPDNTNKATLQGIIFENRCKDYRVSTVA